MSKQRVFVLYRPKDPTAIGVFSTLERATSYQLSCYKYGAGMRITSYTVDRVHEGGAEGKRHAD